jgi:hypothetical protein
VFVNFNLRFSFLSILWISSSFNETSIIIIPIDPIRLSLLTFEDFLNSIQFLFNLALNIWFILIHLWTLMIITCPLIRFSNSFSLTHTLRRNMCAQNFSSIWAVISCHFSFKRLVSFVEWTSSFRMALLIAHVYVTVSESWILIILFWLVSIWSHIEVWMA